MSEYKLCQASIISILTNNFNEQLKKSPESMVVAMYADFLRQSEELKNEVKIDE